MKIIFFSFLRFMHIYNMYCYHANQAFCADIVEESLHPYLAYFLSVCMHVKVDSKKQIEVVHLLCKQQPIHVAQKALLTSGSSSSSSSSSNNSF